MEKEITVQGRIWQFSEEKVWGRKWVMEIGICGYWS